MAKVYIFNSYGNPVHQAKKWGELVEITTGNLNPFAIDRLAWSAAQKLAEFNEDDYLLLTGPGSGYIISTLILLSRFDEIKCLRYEATLRSYEQVTIHKRDIRQAILDAPAPSYEGGPGRIFVINYSGHSIEPAFGYSTLPEDEKLVIITQGNINQFDVQPLIRQTTHQLAGFAEGDMLLLSGPAILHIIAAAVLSVMGLSFSVLIYNPKLRQYVKREISLPHMIRTAKLAKEAVA
jgi:hypothetical protein